MVSSLMGRCIEQTDSGQHISKQNGYRHNLVESLATEQTKMSATDFPTITSVLTATAWCAQRTRTRSCA